MKQWFVFLTSPEIFILMGGVVNQWLPICKEARIHLLGKLHFGTARIDMHP